MLKRDIFYESFFDELVKFARVVNLPSFHDKGFASLEGGHKEWWPIETEQDAPTPSKVKRSMGERIKGVSKAYTGKAAEGAGRLYHGINEPIQRTVGVGIPQLAGAALDVTGLSVPGVPAPGLPEAISGVGSKVKSGVAKAISSIRRRRG